MMNQLLIRNKKIKKKDIEIAKMRSQSDQLRNDLRSKKELMKRVNKPKIYYNPVKPLG